MLPRPVGARRSTAARGLPPVPGRVASRAVRSVVAGHQATGIIAPARLTERAVEVPT